MSIDGWKSLFDWTTVALVFLTFACGAGALITGNKINRREDERLRKFDSDLTKAKTDLGEQQERAAKVEKELATQQERAAVAEKSLLELREKMKDRTVSELQRETFLRLTKDKPKGEVSITTLSGEREPNDFANDLRRLLLDAGWSARPVGEAFFVGIGSVGLTIRIESKQTLAKPDPLMPNRYFIPPNSPVMHGAILAQELQAAGIQVAVSIQSSSKTDEVILMVGKKP